MTDRSAGGTPARGVRISHVFDASRETVFAAWTDPDQVVRWWRPDGFEIPRDTVVIEARVGGRFHLRMVDVADGSSYPYRAEILEIDEPAVIVLKAEPVPEAGIMATRITRVVFEAEGERTRMTVTDEPYTDEIRGNAEAGWLSLIANLEKLFAS
jgi:uncharacterized protein YndB with AHSA1/START domain